MTNWRDLPDSVREEFVTDMTGLLRQRNELGKEQYGDTFQGDPFEHIIGELVDAIFYWWEEKRKRKETQRSFEDFMLDKYLRAPTPCVICGKLTMLQDCIDEALEPCCAGCRDREQRVSGAGEGGIQ